MWIAFQGLLNKKRQTREPGSHIRVSRHKPNPHAAWDRDHLRPKTSSTRPSASASTLASTRTRLPPPRSISIMPTFRPVDRTGGGGVCAKGAGKTLDGKGGDAASWTGIRRGTAGIASPQTLASFRQAKISPRETPCLRATSEQTVWKLGLCGFRCRGWRDRIQHDTHFWIRTFANLVVAGGGGRLRWRGQSGAVH